MKAHTLSTADLFPVRYGRVIAGPVGCSTHHRFTSSEAVARAMRLESVRRLASLEASVRQLSLFNAPPDKCVLDEIAGLRAGIALLDEQSEPAKLEIP